VSAVSKDGLTGTASIAYTVVPPDGPPDGPGDPPDGPGDPPDDPGPPPTRVDLTLGVEREPLSELLRTRNLVLTARLNEPAKVVLTGGVKLVPRARRAAGARFVSVFERTTIRLAAGERKVTLALSRNGARALRRLTAPRLTIVGRATDASGETATTRIALTLRR
jgi:hypothetical protein